MKIYEFVHEGCTYHLCMNAAAIFDIYERFGYDRSVLDPIQEENKEAFDNLCWMLAKLAEQGELVRRWQGHDPEKLPSYLMFRAVLAPTDIADAKMAVMRTYQLAFERELPDEKKKRVDLGLEELQKKTKNGRREASIWRWLRRFWAWISGKVCS